MLTECSTQVIAGRVRLAAYATIIAAFAACAGWSVRADQPTEHVESEAPAARVAALPAREAGQPLFASPPMQPWAEVRANDTGYAVIRVADLYRYAFFSGLFTGAADPLLDQGWRMLATPEAADQRLDLGLGLANVKQLVGSLEIGLTKKPGEQGADHKSNMSLGSQGAVIHFNEPVDHDSMRTAINVDRLVQELDESELDPSVLEDVLKGATSKEFINKWLSDIFTDGGSSRQLWLRSSNKEDQQEFDEAIFQDLKQAWQAVDGGSVTGCFSLPKTLGSRSDGCNILDEGYHIGPFGNDRDRVVVLSGQALCDGVVD